jgi:RND family efflux transporter MFP subunit
VQAAQAALEARRIRQGQTALVAPDDGIISARSATVGAVAGSGTALFRLIRDGRLEWRAQVTASELGRLKPGTVAEITASSGARLEGRVRTIGPTVDPQTREALVYVDVKPVRGDEGHALPGMYARGVFALGSAPALTVPQGAVVLRDGFSYVMGVDGENRIRALKVQTGRVVGDRLEITSELPADLRIVASGGSFLNEGDRVRVVDAGADGNGPGTAAGTGSAPNGTLAK